MQPILILCEGKTEQIYFEILTKRVFRLPSYVSVSIYGEKGQHKALVDRAVAMRHALAEAEGFPEEDIEVWAVCDDDRMPYSYHEFEEYARERRVNLAFSRPQFEAFLVQHFKQSKDARKSDLFSILSGQREVVDGGSYDEGTKGDLTWLETVLTDKPKLVSVAITNASQREGQSSPVFLTVHRLVARLRDLQRG